MTELLKLPVTLMVLEEMEVQLPAKSMNALQVRELTEK